MNTAQTPAVVTPSARPRSAPLWAGLFVLAALATGFVLHRVERASTGRAQGVVSPTADAGDAPPATALPVASPIASAAPEIVDASPSVAIAVRAPAPKVSVAARPTSSARVTPVDTGAAKRGEAGGLRPLDGNPWETSK